MRNNRWRAPKISILIKTEHRNNNIIELSDDHYLLLFM